MENGGQIECFIDSYSKESTLFYKNQGGRYLNIFVGDRRNVRELRSNGLNFSYKTEAKGSEMG